VVARKKEAPQGRCHDQVASRKGGRSGWQTSNVQDRWAFPRTRQVLIRSARIGSVPLCPLMRPS
jgi:hypothetical protein